MKRTSKSRSLRTKKCLSKCIKRRKNFDKSLKIAYGNGIIASLTTKKKLFLWHFAVALRKESVDRNIPAVWEKNIERDVALRKESVDRNTRGDYHITLTHVALRKESVDRNGRDCRAESRARSVALRKESVDRNEMYADGYSMVEVALRKESVDRNNISPDRAAGLLGRSPQGERG